MGISDCGSKHAQIAPARHRRVAVRNLRADNRAMTAVDYLLADVGATNTRVVAATPEGIVGAPVRLRTADFSSSTDLLAESMRRLGLAAARCCIGIAGPVADGIGHLTNGALVFDAAGLATIARAPVTLVNDFHALARALPVLQRLHRLGGTSIARTRPAVKAVIGPGSGLGMTALVPVGRGWQVVGSEGGHADLAPGTPLELELLTLLQKEQGHVSWETVLSGPGLVRIYRAVCALFGAAADDVTPEWITARGVTADDPVCHQALDVFFGLLGSAAGNLALTVGARGGVYIGGGIVPPLAGYAATSPIRARFEDRGEASDYARDIPLYIILDEDPGLIGALECLRDEQINFMTSRRTER
jgi:glucokinase